MQLKKLIENLQKLEKKLGGDVQVKITATTLCEGFSQYKDGCSDVFESTIENIEIMTKNEEKYIKLFH